MLTSQLLQKLAPATPKTKRDRFLPFLNEAMPRYGINTATQEAAFITTCCFESDYFKATEEYASGMAYDKSNNPRKAKALGNTEAGDGPKYKGRSLIQTTGKANYQAFSTAMHEAGVDNAAPNEFVVFPKQLAEPRWAVEAACFFWQTNNLNKHLADGGFFATQGVVNRGNATKRAKDYDKREKLYALTLLQLSAASEPNETKTTVQPTPFTLSEPVTTDPAPLAADSFTDRIFAPITNLRSKFQEIGVDPADISKTSVFTTLLTKLGGWVSLAIGYFTDRPSYLIAGVVLIGLALWYLKGSKDRANARMTAPATNQQVSVEVNK